MQVYREGGTILCRNCARPLSLEGCKSLYRVEEFYEAMVVKDWLFIDPDAGDW